ncbi:MAG TPA: hypothetical protein VF533_10190 [Solirubrobacteraceae bacterium]|jgi:hypothetical protein
MSSAVRTRMILGGLATAVAAIAFWFLVLGPKHEKAAELGAKVEQARTKLATTRAEADRLRLAKSTHDVDYASVVRLGKAVPTDDDVRSLVVQLETAADRSGVDFHSITLSGGAGTSAATPPTAAAPGANTAAATTAALPPGATVGAAGFPTMPFDFEFRGQFFSLSNFFSRLERLVAVSEKEVRVSGRLLTVDSFTFKPGVEGFPAVYATVGATAYLLPSSEGVPLASSMAAATGATPAATTSGTTPVTATTTGAAIR